MTRAFLFPGQGSELPGMGGRLLTQEGTVVTLLRHASELLGADLVDIVRRGDARLTRTEFSQPALAAVSIGIATDAISAGITPDFVTGHSVGELAALCVAGCVSAADAIALAVIRGRAMGAAAAAHPGGMAAVRVRDEADLGEALAFGGREGVVELAAHNGPEEWVITGEARALSAIATRWATVDLRVAGPWHSRIMAAAAPAFAAALARIRLQKPSIPIIMNARGVALADTDDVVALLVGQLTRPVRWKATMDTLVAAGVTEWNPIGPGKVLRGLVRANAGVAARVTMLDGFASLETAR